MNKVLLPKEWFRDTKSVTAKTICLNTEFNSQKIMTLFIIKSLFD